MGSGQVTLGESRGYWNATATTTEFPALGGEQNVDIAIVGGGIVGVTTARLLKDRGWTVALVEARRVGRQVTGQSTAKVTSQHGLLYQTLEEKFGEHRARLYGEAQEAAVRLIGDLVERHHIHCDLTSSQAYTYTLDSDQVAQLEKEVEVTRRLGLPASLVHECEMPFEIAAAIRFDQQLQFHPTNYVAGLAATLPGTGSHVFENSRVIEWEPNRVITDQGVVNARYIVMATHLPLGQVGAYYSRAFPNAEPVIAARINDDIQGMYLSAAEPSYSIRCHRQESGDLYAIVAGSTFKPGHPDEEQHQFEAIEEWLRKNFVVGPVTHRWVNEDYVSMDNAPLVGWSSSMGADYLVATGFAGWGISNGTAAAMMLCDLVDGIENPWLELFDSKRFKPLIGGRKFLKESASVASHLVTGYLSRKLSSYDELERGKAAIMSIEGHNIAAFRDEDGAIHAVSAVCTHMGCIVGWCENDRCWDCPCHGSRFALDGEVLHGPAVRPLKVMKAL
ncbi:MAG: FAD-dependent oxidoreductase [Anaerolineaceae bacterium]|nr:FAD-dependent oxidoreductase [Anaerolineaceae bacterium]